MLINNMKISIVSHSYPTYDTPSLVPFIKQEAHIIAKENKVNVHIPSVLSLPFQKQFYRSIHPNENRLPLHRFLYISFPRRRLASITQKSLSKNLLKSIEKQKPDIVHLHWLYPAGLSAPSLKKAGYPVVITIHGGDWYSNVSNQKVMPLLENSLHKVDKIICVGKQLTDDISDYDPQLKSKLVHIPHGIDVNLFSPTANEERIVNKSGFNAEKKHLLCVANLYHVKGIDLLIKAYSKISNPEKYHLHIISSASDEEAKSVVYKLIDRNKLNQLITFHSSMKQKELVNLIRAADLLISPSRKEGFGLVVAEAIACGTPVLATRSGGPEEIVNPDCGMMVEANSADSLSAGLESILKNLDRYQSDIMHQYIKSNFSIESKKKKLLAVYRDIIS